MFGMAFRLAGLGWVALLATLVPRAAVAQHITIDGTLSAKQTLVGPNYRIGANLGREVGGNLFQSFGIFGLAPGESATFTGPAGIAIIIGRVTGGNPSAINGTIRSAITGANLYLINPDGVVFGSHATVNVSASFYASTADYLRLGHNGRFQATHPDGSRLTAAPPSAFGFLDARPAAITVNGARLGTVRGTLGLIGGRLSIRDATVSARSGAIDATAVAGKGEVSVDPRRTRAATVRRFGRVAISRGSTLKAGYPSTGGGSVFIRAGGLLIDASKVLTGNAGAGSAGMIAVTAGRLWLVDGAKLLSTVRGSGQGDPIIVSARSIVIDGRSDTESATKIGTITTGSATAGRITVSAGNLRILANGEISSSTDGSGRAGRVSVAVRGALRINGASAVLPTGLLAETARGSIGSGGRLEVDAGSLFLDNAGQISVSSFGGGAAGDVTVSAGALTILTNGSIAAGTFGAGRAGDVSVMVAGRLRINGANINAQANPGSTGSAGDVTVAAGTLGLVRGGEISGDTFGSGNGGNVSVSVVDRLTINGAGSALLTGITSQADPKSMGNAGNVAVTAGTLDVVYTGEISGDTFGSGNAGDVIVTARTSDLAHGGIITSSSFGSGNGGDVFVSIADRLTINGAGSTSFTGITSDTEPKSIGNAGNLTVAAGTLDVVHGGEIASGTFGSGNGGIVSVRVVNRLTINGAGSTFLTGITSQADPKSIGNAGNVTVAAGTLDVVHGGEIASGTFGSGNGGDVFVSVIDRLTINGAGSTFLTGITSEANPKSMGNAGDVTVAAGTLDLIHNGQILSSTFGSGSGGDVSVSVADRLTIDGAGSRQNVLTGIGSQAEAGSTNNAGVVFVSAGALSIVDGGAISSSALGARGASPASTGDAGKVTVRVAGRLAIEGSGSLIATTTDPGAIGSAGSVEVRAAQIAITDGGAIASSTAGTGAGGDVQVVAGSDIVLSGTGPQITAQSTGSGDAGAISILASRLFLNEGAAISTAAHTANGGNISLSVTDLLYLADSEITTSVRGVTSTGNGGNITIDAGLAVLDRSEIIAQAQAGNGGNIMIDAGAYVASTDSTVSASSQKGISGTVEINGITPLNGSLAVLSSELHNPAALTRDSCAERSSRPQSGLVAAGRGGLPLDPDASLPALYVAGRDVAIAPRARAPRADAGDGLPATVHLAMRCD
jgi:filamentous hemagglutinin family protein